MKHRRAPERRAHLAAAASFIVTLLASYVAAEIAHRLVDQLAAWIR